ncbi:MAG TPA: lysophospholipid acyltransferase family protein [Dehalococcoidales bacterium]|nr:lysophospholipid acyltransferase family protein [Dehalococcoidales bacterium]
MRTNEEASSKKSFDYYLAELGYFLANKLPVNVSYSIGSSAGDIMYSFWHRGRQNMIQSISKIACSDINKEDINRTARTCMRNYGKLIVDTLRYARADDRFFETNFELEGLHNLDVALEKKKGVILVGFHVGNLDLGPRLLSKKGYPVNAVVRHLGSKGIDAFLQGARVNSGIKLIDAGTPSKRITDVLRNNEILALMLDSPKCEKGVKVKLGTHCVKIPSGASILSLRTGATIIPSVLVRTSNTTFKGELGKQVNSISSGRMVDDIHDLTQRTISAMEAMIKPYKDQWYVFHPLFADSATK